MTIPLLLLLVTLPAQPDPIQTPGVVRPLSRATICATTWGTDRRHVTVAMKRRVATAYGLAWTDRGRVEFDHLIPRELGGADDVRHLWPQAWPAAHRKDVVETRLHRAVCAGTITLAAAQAQMRQWIDPIVAAPRVRYPP